MCTIIETPVFQKQAAIFWSEEERLEFIAYISTNPLDGVDIAGADGARKIRWGRSGKGKRGGVRVIYFNVLDDGYLCRKRNREHQCQTN